MFEPFGPIEGISILRHQDRTSKGVGVHTSGISMGMIWVQLSMGSSPYLCVCLSVSICVVGK